MTIQYNPTLTGNVESYLDGTGAFSSMLDPTKFYFFFDDFIACVKTTTNGGVFQTGGNGLSWSGGFLGTNASASLVTPADSGCIGSALLTSGSAASGNYSQILNSLLDTGISQTPATCPLNDKVFDVIIKAKISSTANISVLPLEYGDFVNNAIGIRYNSASDSTWTAFKTVAGVTTTATITGSTLNTSYHTFRMRAVTAGTILFSVDGGTEVSLSYGATTTHALILNVVTLTNAAKAMSVDYVWGWIKLAR